MSAVVLKKPFGWHASPTMNGRAFDIGAADGSNIALVHGPGNGGEIEFEANARLIAAAPDLLKALRDLAEYVVGIADEEAFPTEYELLQTALKAIAKAEGRS